MIMKSCNVQTKEYDLQAKAYSTICTHHKLRNSNENNIPIFRECIWISDRIWCKNISAEHTTTEKYDNNG